MKIKYVEIQNFRKFKSVRIELSDKTTIFVGANNSGKTSAIVALGHFLVDPRRFTTKDFTLSIWRRINKIGEEWISCSNRGESPELSMEQWMDNSPSLDVWLSVGPDEVHHVNHLIPTLDWAGGLIGVRLQFGPKDLAELQSEFVVAAKNARQTLEDAKASANDLNEGLKLWPQSLSDFIDRRLHRHFGLQVYLLDQGQIADPENGVARPQTVPAESDPLEPDPFRGLIRIDEVTAQRGFCDAGATARPRDGRSTLEPRERMERNQLSDQLRRYYDRHVDPTEAPDVSDLAALHAIKEAQDQFDERLKEGFASALQELESLGYPGVTDPKLTTSTRIRPIDGLDHAAAVQYDVANAKPECGDDGLRLPEQYIRLGYQNLISMVFRLMSFRDAWMQVGKAAKPPIDASKDEYSPAPIHLVMVEEPEAHLHAQVQQVFIRRAYLVLRNHADLEDKPLLSTQLVVSTHSSHIAHESDSSSLRYFRRLPAGFVETVPVPVSSVINLSEVFGGEDATARFVRRYLKTTHCDQFLLRTEQS